jgi:hypothetical protein
MEKMERTKSRRPRSPRMSGPKKARESSTVSVRGNMTPTVGSGVSVSDHGHLSSVDENLAVALGGRPATWHSRRFGHHAVNQLAAAIIEEWRRSGDVEELAGWVRPIEDALAAALPAGDHSPRLRAALADAEEDLAEAAYLEEPCTETARALLRRRAADRLTSLEHDREIAARHGIEL